MDHEIDQSEGEINLGNHRTAWQAQHIDAATSELLAMTHVGSCTNP